MDSSDQRRKRKRFFRQSYSSSYLLAVRFLVVFLGFLSFLSLLSYTSPSTSSALRPALVVSSLSLLSSSSSRTVKSVREFGKFFSPLKIEGRVLFPDHVLVLLSGGRRDGLVRKSDLYRLECVYYGKFDGFGKGSVDYVKKKVLSVDEYGGFRSIVRCPLAPESYSNVVHLKRVGKNAILGVRNQTVKSWDNVAYAAARDGETAVVFVKGLNLRPDRESNPRQFRCYYGLGKWDRNGRFNLSTRALTAAQEVVRCPLPKSVSVRLDRGQGIRVTVGLMPRSHEPVLVPSVAKILDLGRRSSEGKFELCVCTMVWNQASAIREWIKYHAWLGVGRWFIYDNNSDDGIDEVIQELDLQNYNVTRHVWPWIKTQEAGFSHCALRAKDECSWVSFMDVDEYYYFPYSTPGHQSFRALGYAPQNSLRALVANLSSSSSSVAEIRTSCHSFGPSGLRSPPSQGVTVGYTCRLQSPERHKSIIRPDALDATLLNVVHHFHLKEGYNYLNLPQSSAVINHYKYQVWEVFRAKFYRRVATYVADWQQNQNEGSRDRAPGLGTEAIEPTDWPQRFCEVWDTGLRDFVLANLADLSTGLLPWEMMPSASTV
ncbi:glycosyltransferase family protein [Perilla frutescens var. hirtella]|uniref:Glycosyltransferase family 92 protein n=1 Tax=Perilla frutescens var. hirtella TaxID=608512 RepID=A0AAD4P0F2_PERFH|nr:glycosyltransferase family protein [Perilla frutescens var. hirtella]KAH6822368.1 glycosyltransferase family protein [Perilla frutescens var. hirtella]